jgi:hypothetical protein
MTRLQDSVGDSGKNLLDDVIAVQTLLKARGLDPGPTDGTCRPATIVAIRTFQAAILSHPDGLIEPGGRTWQRLTAPGASPEVASEWTGDSSTWPEEKKIRSMHADLRPKVTAVLAGLRGRGFQPKVFYGWRSVAVQQKLFEQGNSKVRFSFHNAQHPNGIPNAYAADIVDARWGWNDEAEVNGFWRALGEEAHAHGLVWGGDWVSFKDVAHVQLVGNSELARVKRESGLA